jgi:hypothetical protein
MDSRVRSAASPAQPARLHRLLFALSLLFTLTVILASGDTRWNAIQGATRMSLSGEPPGSHPIPEGTVERQIILPVTGIDGKWWVLHAEKMLREGRLRVRHTDLDNAPSGREVHWSSGLMWLIIALGWAGQLWSQLPIADSLSLGAALSGPLLFFVGTVAFGLLFRAGFGWLPAALAVVLFSSFAPISDVFRLGDCDHHGMVSWFAMAGVLCLVLGQGGLAGTAAPRRGSRTNDTQRRWFVWAGLAMGAALWVSAATAIPIIVAVAVGAVVVALLRGEAGVRPELWRVWGLAGGLASLGFYVLEYFPGHLGLRLEVNHPIYGLAWMGGAEILSRVVRRIGGGRILDLASISDRAILILALVATSVPVLLVAAAPGAVFWVADPFLLALHERHIAEFQNLIEATTGPAQPVVLGLWFALPLASLFGMVALAMRGSVGASERAGFALAGAVAVVLLGMGALQVRWFLVSAFFWSLFSALVCSACLGRCAKGRWWWGFWIFALLAVGVLPSTAIVLRKWQRTSLDRMAIPRDMATNLIARDLVHRLLHMSSKRPILLSGPTTSTDLAYYGTTPVVGTLYWENRDGLKAAASIFSATTDEDARQAMEARGITHVVLFSWDDFVEQYQSLLEEGTDTEASFFARLVGMEEPPQWLRPLAYPIPEAMGLAGEKVYLYEFAPHQSRGDWLMARGLYAMDMGDQTKALGLLRQALAEDPSSMEAQRWVAQIEAALRALDPPPSQGTKPE